MSDLEDKRANTLQILQNDVIWPERMCARLRYADGGRERWSDWNVEGAPGSGIGAQCANSCLCDQGEADTIESNSADCVDRYDTAKYPRTNRQHVDKGAQVARLQKSPGVCGQRSASCGLCKVPRAASGTW